MKQLVINIKNDGTVELVVNGCFVLFYKKLHIETKELLLRQISEEIKLLIESNLPSLNKLPELDERY